MITYGRSDLGLLSIYIAYSSCSVFAYWKSVRNCILSLISSYFEQDNFSLRFFFNSITCVVVITILLVLEFYFELWCDNRPIHGIPSISGGLPIAGNLFQQGPSAPITYWSWGHDVFQLRLGTKRVVVANTYNAIEDLWQTNWRANISRPVLYTFHKIMSASQGTTVGTTPFSESWRRMRKAIAANLSLARVKSYSHIIERQSAICIKNLEGLIGEEVNVYPVFESFTLCIVHIFDQLLKLNSNFLES